MKNKTILTQENLKYINKKPLKYTTVMFCSSLVIACAMVFLFILKSFTAWIFLAVALGLALGGLFLFFTIKKSISTSINKELDYEFNEENFVVTSGKGTTTWKYEVVIDIVEDDLTYYLYISKTNVYIVSKNGFESNSTDIKSFLESKCFPERQITIEE